MLRVLQITAHPDDETLWAGGWWATLKAAQSLVVPTFMCCSPEHGSSRGVRVAEFEAACAQLGAEPVVLETRGWFNRDRGASLRREFARVQIEKWSVIVTHSALGELNQSPDHRWVYNEVKRHLRNAEWKGLFLTFGIGTAGNVSLVVDNAAAELKAKALAEHKTQSTYTTEMLRGSVQQIETLRVESVYDGELMND